MYYVYKFINQVMNISGFYDTSTPLAGNIVWVQ